MRYASGATSMPLASARRIPEQDPLTRGLNLGMLYSAAGDQERAEQNFRSAETYALELQKREPEAVNLGNWPRSNRCSASMKPRWPTSNRLRAKIPESRDGVNGPPISFLRSIILVRAGRTEEGYAEVQRLLGVPYGRRSIDDRGPPPLMLTVMDDPKFDELIYHPPRL